MKIMVKDIITALELQPHPEGGYFKETYRSKGEIAQQHLTTSFSGKRNYCTGIYFLLTSDSFSAFHRIKQDEMWHFYNGNPLKLHIISPDGNYTTVTIGNAILDNEVPQYVVPAGHWFAAEVTTPNTYALVGCTVAPGFNFDDFEMPNREQLVSKFPQHTAVISKLTRA